MTFHDLFRSLFVACEHGFHQFLVFFEKNRMICRILDIFQTVAVNLFSQIIDDLDQPLI